MRRRAGVRGDGAAASTATMATVGRCCLNQRGAAHQGAGGAGRDEKDVEVGEFGGDGGGGAVVVGFQLLGLAYLVEPDVAGVGGD